MLFTVSLKPGFGLGTTVCNDASIVFDFNPPIDTTELLQHDRRARGLRELHRRRRRHARRPRRSRLRGARERRGRRRRRRHGRQGRRQVREDDPQGRRPSSRATAEAARRVREGGRRLRAAEARRRRVSHEGAGGSARRRGRRCRRAEAKLTAAIAKACGEPDGDGGESRRSGRPRLRRRDGAARAGARGRQRCDASRRRRRVRPPATPVRRRAHPRRRGAAGARAARARRFRSRGRSRLRPAPTAAARRSPPRSGRRSASATPRSRRPRQAAGGRAKAAEACGAAVFTCLQTKPGDPACVGKAGGTCTKAVAGIPKLASRLRDDHRESLRREPARRGRSVDVRRPRRVGARASAARKLGIASLATVADVTACLEAQLTCHVDHLLERRRRRGSGSCSILGGAFPDPTR